MKLNSNRTPSQPATRQRGETTADKVLNRYLRQRFGFAYRVNGYLAKYLRKSGTDQNLARTLRRIEDSIGQRIRVDHRGMLQWQPER